MPKSKEKWIQIGGGGEGYNTWWDDVLAPVMDQITRYIYAIEEHQLKLNWKEICDNVPALQEKGWHISEEHSLEDFLTSLEYCTDCCLIDEEFEDGMPGQSGHFWTLELENSKKRSFLHSMEQLRSSLETYWKTHCLPEF
jgi:hypothetical protein